MKTFAGRRAVEQFAKESGLSLIDDIHGLTHVKSLDPLIIRQRGHKFFTDLRYSETLIGIVEIMGKIRAIVTRSKVESPYLRFYCSRKGISFPKQINVLDLTK